MIDIKINMSIGLIVTNYFLAKQETLNQLLLPPNCISSSFVGYQTLRSGENIYCDGGWTVSKN